MKNCTNKTCGEKNPQPLTNFSKHKTHNDGLQYYCKKCQAKNKRNRSLNPKTKEQDLITTKKYNDLESNKIKRRKLVVHKYWKDLTIDEAYEKYNELLNKQNKCCAICKRNQKDLSKSLFVDHNHKTSKVRGLLCYNCNYAIGLFYENIETLQNAIHYLKNTEKK